MQTLQINLNSQQSFGNDTQWQVNLPGNYEFNRIKLRSFTCPNWFSNIVASFTDFSFRIGAVTYSMTIQQRHLTLAQWVAYFNANNGQGLTLAQTYQVNNPNLLILTGNVAWSPVGTAWTRYLGYLTLYTDRPLALAQSADTYFNFMQSSVLIVQFNNISNAYMGGDMTFSFSLPLASISSFGQQYVWDSLQESSYQEVRFSNVQKINSLVVQLLDSNGAILQTQNTNGTDFNVIMNLGLYKD